MSLTLEDLENLSQLARISIKEDEKEKMLHDMQAILGYVSEINDIEGERSTGTESVYNVVREDVITHETGSNTDALLAEAPLVQDGYVQVEQVLK
jgi:aspartyl-tRNA(Asn)/glutamyl-tRNA(Gln) amidotransferase subunit C